MSRIVYEFTPDQRSAVEDLTEEDPLSRQSIKIKDGDALDVDREALFVFVEGDEEVLDQAGDDFEELGGAVPTDAQALFDEVDDEEAAAASGVGSIFGD
jgi:hypothetical protein